MSGPCLCGDPYCPHCGGADSALLELEEEIGDVLDIKTEAEGRYLLALIPAALAAFRDTQEWERKEAARVAAQEAALEEAYQDGDRYAGDEC